MLKNTYYFLIAIFAFQCVSAQVKIGSNPNTIDAASIMELESNDKALVLTRLSNAEMTALTPLRGALIYNTDSQCVHFYDSTQWVNLCNSTNTTGFSFTDNGNGTITLVNDIGGTLTFNGAPETISTLEDNLDGTFTYTDENGIATTISGASSQSLTTDGTAGNVGIADGNTIVLNVDDADADDQNEIQDLQFSGGLISLTNDPDATIIDISGITANTANIATNATDIDNLEAEQTTQNDAIALNTAKVGITTVQADIIANTSGVNTGDQDISGIAINAADIDNLETEQVTQNTNIVTNATDIDNLEAEQTTQNDAIALNTAKVGITTAQADIIANTSGVNTGDQDISGIAINVTDIDNLEAEQITQNTNIGTNAADIDNLEAEQTTQNDAIAINTAKVGITTAQADIVANTSGVNTGDQDISGIATNATDIDNLEAEQTTQNTNIATNATDIDNLEAEQTTQNDAIALNTAKVGITTTQADIIANTSGVNTGDQDISGIAINAADIDNLEAEQTTQNDAIAINTAKVGITTVQADIIANTSGVNTGDQDISGIAINAADIDNLETEQITQNDAIAINTSKVGITTVQADIIANTSGVNTGDQDISGIAINAADIDNLETEQTIQNDAIAINTAKVGITTAQADIIANTAGVNTGDQDISGIAINATDIDNLETEQITQNDAIAINTSKVGITTVQADIIANTSGVNTGDQDISGIAINAADIDNLETEQTIQNDAIAINTAKVGITTAQADIIANTAGVNTGDQDISGIAINATDIDNLETEQITQNDAIAINTSKVGITTVQADIIANTSGVNTGDQDISGIAINAADIDNLETEQTIQNDAIAINTAKVGITTAQADIIANTAGVNTGDQDISGIAINATDIDNLETEQITQNDAIAINTSKVGITTVQADIIANTSGVNTGDQDISGIAINAADIDNLETEQTIQNDAIAINTAKVGITTAQADIIANTAGVNTGDQDISGIAINATDIDNLETEQITQNDAIAFNTAKVGITTVQADIIANTSGVNTGDQDISGIAINATDIDNLETEQITQNDAIALNTAKVGITTVQADIIANTSGVNTGDQDISGIAINATDIDNLEAEQTTQNDAIAINTAKVGITTTQADIIANTSGVNTGDQDISGIAINAINIATNATDIDNLETEQTTQNDAIAINTAKVGITTTQADIIANTSGVNTGDQDISGIAINASDIDNLEAEQITQNDAITLNTAKVGITTTQADIIANTSGVNTGDQDISGIAINATDIDNLETEQTTQNTNITTNATDIDNLEIEQITQNDAIAINTAKVGITTVQADIIANTSGVNTGDQDISGIAINATDIDNLETEQTTQNDAIAINTAKVGITTVQADIIANTSGVNTGDQDISGIAINATDIDNLESEQITQNDAIAINTSKVGITTAQADIIANTSGVNTGDQDISGIAINATDIDNLEAEQITQNDAIAINTAKVGITTVQADIIANTSGVNTGDQDISGIAINATDIDNLEAEQTTQNDAIALNTVKVGITTAQADIIANTSGVNTGDQDISGIAINATDIDNLESEQTTQNTGIATNATDIDNLEAEQITQNDAIAINTAKVGITTVQADIIANTSGVNTGDQDISGIAINATDIDNLESEQITQNDAIALNTAKVGITTTQADIIANTSGVNTGDQDISGIAINATNIATNTADIDNLETEQTIQNDAIALNTVKVGITTAQADIIANTSGVNTGDQDISGIAINATDIDNLETEQTTQNDAIALNTAKVGITTVQADIIANTSGVNTGDQDISGIAINATDIDNLEAEQTTQNDAIAINTAKVGITTTQADIIANTSGVNMGDQDISGIAINAINIATNATDIDNLETEQTTQNDAIAINTAKVGITTTQADIIANTSGVNTGDQDISGIAINASDIDNLEAEQITQNDAITLNTAKVGITTTQADIIANTSGVNTGDQDISGIAINATDIDNLETEQTTQNTNITSNAAAITAHITADGDLNDSNEIQTLSILGNALSISGTGGNSVTLPSISGTAGSLFFAAADGTPTEDNAQLFWNNTTNSFGVGTASPTNKFHVTGAIRSQGMLNSNGTANEPSYRFNEDINTGLYRPAADEIGFSVGGIEALKIEETSNNTSVIVNETLELEGPVLDSNNSPGTAGQVLSSNVTGTQWVNSLNPIKAFGKIASGGGVTKATTGVTSTRLSTGRYRVSLPAGTVSDADYIIQLTQPGRGGAGNDDPGISYSNQTATSFEVIIGDNDNGGTDRSRFDSEFMFTILDL